QIGVDPGQVATPTGEDDPVGNTEPVGMLFHLLAQGAVADDDEASGLLLGGDTRRSVEEEAMVLDREDPPDDAHQGGAVAHAQLPAKTSPVARAVEERLQREAERDDADLFGIRYSIADQITLDL